MSRGIATEADRRRPSGCCCGNAALGMYADPAWAGRRAGRRSVRGCWSWRACRRAGSDHQLAFLNTLLTGVTAPTSTSSCADSSTATTRLRTVCRDSPSTPTRCWRIVKALATAGVIDQPEIDAERERDSTGRPPQCRRARAARPSTRRQAAAWQAAMVDDSLPNITVRAIAEGFAGPGQNEVLAPYADEYFATIADVWGRRSSEVAFKTVVVGLYPDWDISDDGLARADRFLAGDHPPALRRLVLEGRDSVARALRAQRFDREDRANPVFLSGGTPPWQPDRRTPPDAAKPKANRTTGSASRSSSP